MSALMISGFTTDWWLELGWNENTWRLEYKVLSNNSEKDGSEVIIPFPECKSTSLDTFIKQLTNAVEELITTANGEALPS